MVAGLATVTPASGNVGPAGAIILGAAAGFVCYFACGFIKGVLKIDDSLDVFAVHGVGGIMGSLLVAFRGVDALGGSGVESAGAQLVVQVKVLAATIILSAVGTVAIALAIRATIGLRVSGEEEELGLDESSHGESAYRLEV
jgi:Amt family ammonium transporter